MAGTGLAIILLGAALLVFFHGQGEIAGLPPDQFASLVALGALVLMIAGWVAQEFRGHWLRGLQAILFWVVLTVGLAGLYSYRGELHEVASRLIGDLAPAEPVVGTGGEVSVTRRMNGPFVVPRAPTAAMPASSSIPAPAWSSSPPRARRLSASIRPA
jgi:aspartyl protease family protein